MGQVLFLTLLVFLGAVLVAYLMKLEVEGRIQDLEKEVEKLREEVP